MTDLTDYHVTSSVDINNMALYQIVLIFHLRQMITIAMHYISFPERPNSLQSDCKNFNYEILKFTEPFTYFLDTDSVRDPHFFFFSFFKANAARNVQNHKTGSKHLVI